MKDFLEVFAIAIAICLVVLVCGVILSPFIALGVILAGLAILISPVLLLIALVFNSNGEGK